MSLLYRIRECVNNSSSYDYKLRTIETLSQYIIIIIRKSVISKKCNGHVLAFVSWGQRREDNMLKKNMKKNELNEEGERKTEIRQSSPRHGREGSRWHRLASAVQAPASHTTPTQQQNQKKKRTTKSTQRSQQTGRNEQKCVKK